MFGCRYDCGVAGASRCSVKLQSVIKSFLLSKMTYVFSNLPTPQEFIKQLNTIIYNFLWNGPDKIARLAVVNDIKFGGLRLTDIETSIIS